MHMHIQFHSHRSTHWVEVLNSHKHIQIHTHYTLTQAHVYCTGTFTPTQMMATSAVEDNADDRRVERGSTFTCCYCWYSILVCIFVFIARCVWFSQTHAYIKRTCTRIHTWDSDLHGILNAQYAPKTSYYTDPLSSRWRSRATKPATRSINATQSDDDFIYTHTVDESLCWAVRDSGNIRVCD